jgi:hypothetical protein
MGVDADAEMSGTPMIRCASNAPHMASPVNHLPDD